MNQLASISPCQQYRWDLTRVWEPRLPRVCWVMLNLSTADSEQDDSTMRKCVQFSRIWGFGSLVVVNLFPYRSTDPSKIPHSLPTDVQDCNSYHILQAIRHSVKHIAAWGANPRALEGVKSVEGTLDEVTLECLRVTKGGFPSHPLYIPYNTSLIPYTLRRGKP